MAEEVTETLLPLAERRGITIETSGDIATTTGSPALLLPMTTNLVHNAIVHNLPEQGSIWLTTSVQPSSVTLTVENTGEKLSPQLVATLAEPFRRGSERIHADHSGAGLGLSIVERIARAHDGTLTLAARPTEGSAPRCGYPSLRDEPAASSHEAPQWQDGQPWWRGTRSTSLGPRGVPFIEGFTRL